MNHTTERFARTSRGSGTEYAASIERRRRTDWSGFLIIAGLFTIYFVALGLYLWNKA